MITEGCRLAPLARFRDHATMALAGGYMPRRGETGGGRLC